MYQLRLGVGRERSKQRRRIGPVGVQGGGQLHERLHDALQVLQLLACENQPGAEHDVAQVRVHHGEEHVVDLQNKADHVEHAVAGIPRIEGLDGQPGYLDGDARVRLLVDGEFHALPKEGDRGPGRGRSERCQHDQKEELAHLGQGYGMVAGIRFREQWMRVGLVPDVQSSSRNKLIFTVRNLSTSSVHL